MHKKFEINWTKIKGGCQSGRKVVPQDSKSDLPLIIFCFGYYSNSLCVFLRTFKERCCIFKYLNTDHNLKNPKSKALDLI